MLDGAQNQRLCRMLFVIGGALTLIGLVALTHGAGVASLAEFRIAGLWYVRHQLHDNALFVVLLVPACLCVAGLLVVSLRGRSAFRRDLARGAVPARQVEAVTKERVVREARSRIEPEVARAPSQPARVVDVLLGLPVDLGAGGLLLEPGPMVVEVKLQLAMERLPVTSMSPGVYEGVLARLRRMTGIDDTGEGRLDLRSGEAVEPIRVVISPGLDGVKTRLQLLNRPGFTLTIEELDLPAAALRALCRALDAKTGVVLVGGPAGHGVTTTLYAAAHHIDRRRQRPGLIASVERPVRHDLPFIHQTEIGNGQPDRVLASVLGTGRHQVVIVRHLDQPETIRLALDAARDRLLLGCLPAPSAAEAVQRTAAMVDPAELGALLRLSLGQRLVRRLCPVCRVEALLAAPERDRLEAAGASAGDLAGQFFVARGCDSCGGTGFAGRLPIYEWIVNDDHLRGLLAGDRTARDALKTLYRREGNSDLITAGLQQAREGQTSVADVIRASGS